MVLNGGVPPGGGYGCRGGLLFFVGAFGGKLSSISHIRLNYKIFHFRKCMPDKKNDMVRSLLRSLVIKSLIDNIFVERLGLSVYWETTMHDFFV